MSLISCKSVKSMFPAEPVRRALKQERGSLLKAKVPVTSLSWARMKDGTGASPAAASEAGKHRTPCSTTPVAIADPKKSPLHVPVTFPLGTVVGGLRALVTGEHHVPRLLRRWDASEWARPASACGVRLHPPSSNTCPATEPPPSQRAPTGRGLHAKQSACPGAGS